ncbi:MAG: hypothetical protein QM723_23055 [Myxococcaceae bacterium]
MTARLDSLQSFGSFMDRAAEKNVLFRRDSWREVIHPLVSVDFTRPETMTEVGIDPKGSGSYWTQGPLTVMCVELSDPKKFEEKAKAKLKVYGSDWSMKSSGLQFIGAKDAIDRVQAAYVIKGKLSCSAAAPGQSIEKAIPELAKVIASGASAKGFGAKGELVIRSGAVLAGLHASGLTVEADLRSAGLELGKIGAGSSPYADAKAPGLALMKLHIEPGQLAHLDKSAVAMIAQSLSLPSQVVQQTATTMGEHLSGNLMMLVSRVQVNGSLRTAAGRFSSMRQAWVAEAKSAADAEELKKMLAATPGAVADGEGWSLRTGVRAGVQGVHVWFSNDPDTLKTLMGAIPEKPGAQKHGLELELDPKLLAKALSQVPLLDAVSDPNLAGLLAASSEAGPLLLITQRLALTADGENGSHTGHLVWTLAPSATTDAGR